MQINIKLDQGFTDAFYALCKKYGEEMRALNGFSESQMNYTDFIDNFVDKNNVADASIDGNANVSTKDVTSLLNEMNKPHMKLLSFHKIYCEMRKKYGVRRANEWLEAEWNGKFYNHDAYSTSFLSYCFSYDLERVAKEGLFFVKDFNAQPPKHLVTFTDFTTEFISWVSNRTSGGCSIPNFLIWSFYFWKKDVESGYYIKSPEYYRDQEFQRHIYKLNQPFLRITQSAYTTMSILDEDYLVELFGGMEYPDGTYVIDYIDDIIEYEKAFMKVVQQCHEQNMMTYPVLSYSLIFDYQQHKFKHEEFARWCSDTNSHWMDSNFSIDDGVNALSSCCVKGETIICVRNTVSGEESIYQIQDFIDQFNDKDEEYIKACDTKFEIKAFDYERNEWVYKNIIGLIRKKNDYDFLLKFNIDGKKIEVTPDHIMFVVDTEINQMVKISAIELSRNIDKYLLVIEE